RGEPGRVARTLRPQQPVRQPARAEGALELGDLLTHAPTSRMRVHDDGQLAVGARHRAHPTSRRRGAVGASDQTPVYATTPRLTAARARRTTSETPSGATSSI